MDKSFGNFVGFRTFEKGKQVVNVGVHTAITDQTQQKQSAISGLCPFASFYEIGIVEDCLRMSIRTSRSKVHTYFAFDIQIDSHNVLVDHSTGANVEMSNLGVAHQTGGQAHR